LVFITQVYHDARSTECEICHSKLFHVREAEPSAYFSNRTEPPMCALVTR